MSDSGAQVEDGAETKYEDEHVHQVYNSIASHFSSTRFKPWPVVDSFLRDLPPGSIGLDIGCGNGKYLTVRNDVYIVASDRSSELLKFAAAHQPHDILLADTLSLPHLHQSFDFAISIAVVHHLSTRARRREAVRSILDTLKTAHHGKDEKGGEALIFVWALEQKGSRRGWDTGDSQDVLVPWVLKDTKDTGSKKSKQANVVAETASNGTATIHNGTEHSGLESKEGTTYHRYYHLYRQGELEEDVVAVGGVIVRNGYDRDNWWVVCTRNNQQDNNGVLRISQVCSTQASH